MKATSSYLSGEPEAPSRLSATTVKADVEEDVRQADFPDACPEYADLIAARSVAEFEFVAPVPIDERASQADRRLLADLEENDRLASAAAADLKAATKLRDERAQAVVALPRPASRAYWVQACLLLVLYAGILSVCGAALLAPTIEPALNRLYATRMDNPDALSLLVAHVVAGGLFLLLCLAHMRAVYGTRGQLSGAGVALMLFVDIAFAAAWGLQRLAAPWPLAASVTLLEVVAAAMFTLNLVGFGAELRRNEPKVAPYRDAVAARDEAERLVAKARRDDEAAQAKRRDLLEAVARREVAVRRRAERQKLIELSANAAYATAVSELASAAAVNPSADAYTSAIDRELETQSTAGKAAQKWSWPWRK